MIVNSYYYPEIYGGAEFSVKKLAEKLSEMGHQVCVLCSGENYSKETIDGVQVFRIVSKNASRACDTSKLGFLGRKIRRFQEIYNKKNKKAILDVIEQFSPDVIHTNNLYNITPVIWEIAYKKKIRIVHTLRDYFLICPRVSLQCKSTKFKKCNRPMFFCKLHRSINSRHSKYVDVVTAPSGITLNTILEEGLFKNAKKQVVLNATDFVYEDIKCIADLKKKRLQNNSEGLTFVYLGTLSEQKGIRWMINSFNAVKDKKAKLIIAGKGELENYVKQSASSNPAIEFVGFLDEKQIDELLKNADVLICPSLWDEPFGRVVLDANKRAMPVISSNKGALPELVKDGVTGTVVQANDITALTESFNNYIQHHDLVIQQGQNSIECLEQYSIDHQVNRFLRIYRKEDADVIN